MEHMVNLMDLISLILVLAKLYHMEKETLQIQIICKDCLNHLDNSPKNYASFHKWKDELLKFQFLNLSLHFNSKFLDFFSQEILIPFLSPFLLTPYSVKSSFHFLPFRFLLPIFYFLLLLFLNLLLILHT